MTIPLLQRRELLPVIRCWQQRPGPVPIHPPAGINGAVRSAGAAAPEPPREGAGPALNLLIPFIRAPDKQRHRAKCPGLGPPACSELLQIPIILRAITGASPAAQNPISPRGHRNICGFVSRSSHYRGCSGPGTVGGRRSGCPSQGPAPPADPALIRPLPALSMVLLRALAAACGNRGIKHSP